MLGDMLTGNRAARPLIHCITNYVTANDCANLLLASGSSPIMADDADEAAEVTAMCDGLVLNMGTPNPRKFDAMLNAGRKANELGHPVVLDPVGVGSSHLRRDAAKRLMETVRFAAIRGNASEIRTLVRGTANHRGVDADDDGDADSESLARQLARKSGAVVIVTGDRDIVTDGETLYRVSNGHAMMRSVTGAGCQLSALVGAYAAANPEQTMTAALAAVCAMGVCGEIAHERLTPADGNATYRNYIIDALYNLTPDELERKARYEVE